MAPTWNGDHNGQVKLGGPGHWWATNAFDYSLDVITLLAVIGEQSMSHHSQVINAHWSCLLPRLLPAPQAFLKPNRPNSLPHVDVKVIGVNNGVRLESISLFADSLLECSVQNLPQYSFHAIQIVKGDKDEQQAESNPEDGKDVARNSNSATPGVVDTAKDLERGPNLGPSHGDKTKDSKTDSNSGNDEVKDVKLTANKKSPLVALAYISCGMSIGILIAALIIHDGMGVIAITILSLASSLIGIASKWEPKLTTLENGVENSKLPDSDIILQTRAGAFVLVKCDEYVSRELFAGTNQCIYWVKSTRVYRIWMSLATVLIMVSVIFLGNCRWEIKAAIGGCYILLNLFYWVADMYKPTTFWDLSGYVTEVLPSLKQEAKRDPSKISEEQNESTKEDSEETSKCIIVEENDRPTFTRAVWQAIYSSGSTDWAEDVVPRHQCFKNWLKEAAKQLGNPRWKAVLEKDRAFAELKAMSQTQANLQNATPRTTEPPTTDLPRTENTPTNDYRGRDTPMSMKMESRE